MSPTQKRYIQLPLFLAIVFFFVLPLEWSVFSRLPWNLGPFSVFAVILTYIAHTRGLVKTVFLALGIGYLSSFSYPFALGAVVAAQAWSTLGTKLMTFVLPFDTPRFFALLVCFQAVLAKILWRIFTMAEFHGVSWLDFTLNNIPSTLTIYVASFFLLPILVMWDEYFENNPSGGTRELSPRITGMSR